MAEQGEIENTVHSDKSLKHLPSNKFKLTKVESEVKKIIVPG